MINNASFNPYYSLIMGLCDETPDFSISQVSAWQPVHQSQYMLLGHRRFLMPSEKHSPHFRSSIRDSEWNVINNSVEDQTSATMGYFRFKVISHLTLSFRQFGRLSHIDQPRGDH